MSKITYINFDAVRYALNLNLVAGSRWVLLALCVRSNASFEAWPSVDDIAKTAGVCKNSVRKHLRILVSLGLIRVVEANRKTTTYRIAHPNTVPVGDTLPLPELNLYPSQNCALPLPELRSTPPKFDPKYRDNLSTKKEEEEPAPPAPPAPAPTTSSSSFKKSAPKPAPVVAVSKMQADWEKYRVGRGLPPLPAPAKFAQLKADAVSLGQSLDWLFETMLLNGWASFQPAFLNNKFPAPTLPPAPPAQPAQPAQPASLPLLAPAPPPLLKSAPRPVVIEIVSKLRGDTDLPSGCGWALEIVGSFIAGNLVSNFPLSRACELLGVCRKQVRALQKR